MAKSEKHTVSIELVVKVVDKAALKAHAEALMRADYADDPDMLQDELGELRHGHTSALSMALDPEHLAAGVPGIKITESRFSVSEDPTEAFELEEPPTTTGERQDQAAPSPGVSTIERFAALGSKVRILALEDYAKEFEDGDPDAEDFKPNPMLAGALLWSYEVLVDQLLEDITMLRTGMAGIEDAACLAELPELYRMHYTPLFAQRYLAVTMDLGTSLLTGFSSPSCVAQELALRLLFNGVEILQDMYPELELPDGWRPMLEDLMFEDLDHEFLYEPGLDGIAGDSSLGHLRIVNLDVAHWFAPFHQHTVNPYAHDAGIIEP
ncbi:hypothetical protein [Paeniglutamicibacter psychrophenolicus]|uniref:hypothetical protein n=1 Tax=Paeniglutamicibacter psychrophenolicus TaxID=257454 RepID=UPI0027876720|nr:hypothetical protein [Paeniglutamicibacter psychrophenolicus]MDQ0096023.1 hypothetical protein [Paeniglutamicibacter psychrophenolicus]